MTPEDTQAVPPATPATPKAPPPPLTLRAPRPEAVRVRRSVVVAAVLAAAGLLAAAFTWAFVITPALRAEARAERSAGDPDRPAGAVRPAETITDGPDSYAALDRLPPPRGEGLSGDETLPPSEEPAAVPTRVATADYGPAPVVRSAPPPSDAGAEARRSALFFSRPDPGGAADPPSAGSGPAARPESSPDLSAVYNPRTLSDPLSPYELKAGAILPAALLTGVDTGRPGPVVAVVTADVFDTVSGRHRLIPQGSRLIGRHDGESRYGDRRAFLVWQRLILPDGRSLVLDDEAGVDGEGTTGVQGRVDRRLGALLTATLFSGAITTLGTLARDRDTDQTGFWGDAGDAAAIEAARTGGRLVERELEVRPTVALRPGTVVRVLITRDLMLEPYPS